MFVLIMLLTGGNIYNNSTSQQITFKTKKGCEIAVSGIKKQNHVVQAFCVQKD